MSEQQWGEGSEAPGVTRLLRNGQQAVQIATPLASGLVYLQGAHVAAFQPVGQAPVLFMSERSSYAPGKALRGGVPICFPWFGNHPERQDLPAHGFARTRAWRYHGSAADAQGVTTLRFVLTDDAETRALWPHAFSAELAVSIGRELALQLSVTATGSELSYEQALHSYFAVSDVRACKISGLAGAPYFDKVVAMKAVQITPELVLEAETDRVYESDASCMIEDPGLARALEVSKGGSATTVIWNPWLDKARKMSDFGDDEWPRMLCVESASVGANRITLAAGQSARLVQRVAIR